MTEERRFWRSRCLNPRCATDTVYVHGGPAEGTCPHCGHGLHQWAQATEGEYYGEGEHPEGRLTLPWGFNMGPD